jgi:long-chain acyl-CoA synthetase
MLQQADTIVEILCRRIEADGARPALGVKRNGKFEWLSWNDIAAQIARVTAALLHLGVQPGDRVVQLSENRHEWIVADLAIQMAGAIHVPIHAPLTGVQIAWQIRHSGAKVALLSGPQQAAKLTALGGECPTGVKWLSFDPCGETLAGQPIATLADLQAAADQAKGIDAACQARKSAAAGDLATILYTSGTTGEPKGVMLTQGNLASNACATVEAFGYAPDDVRLNFLPLSHIFARTCDLYCWLVEGSRMAVAESRDTVIPDCHAVQPTHLNGVPHFYDRVYRALGEKGARDKPGALAATLGGAIRRCCAGGAALPDYLYDYYHGQGVPLLQGYRLSESSPVITLSTESSNRRGSCGRALPGALVQIAGDGEILTRGPHVMPGYYENPQATAEVLRDGWLATGDLGRLDDDGFLYITGRKKELIVTLGGKNIAPVFLESLLTQDPLILQALVVGDGRPCLSALIVPNPDILKHEIVSRGITITSLDKALIHPEVLYLFQQRINERLACVSPHEQVRKFTLLSRGFSIEAGELTPKLTLRRKEIAIHFAAEIEAMYS